MMLRVLVIEDDEIIGRAMVRHLLAAGADPTLVSTGEEGLAQFRSDPPDVCVLDLTLPGIDGWRLIETVRSSGISTPIIIVSARAFEQARARVLGIGSENYLVKPFPMRELVKRVDAAAESR